MIPKEDAAYLEFQKHVSR